MGLNGEGAASVIKQPIHLDLTFKDPERQSVGFQMVALLQIHGDQQALGSGRSGQEETAKQGKKQS
jgi:hypothetical protein